MHGAIILSAIMVFTCLGRPATAQKAQDLAGTLQGAPPVERPPHHGRFTRPTPAAGKARYAAWIHWM